MSLDTISDFGNNRSSKRYLHLLVDHVTRFAFILTTKGQTSNEMIQLVDSVHNRHPIGTRLTDQYGGLFSQEFQDYCDSSGIRHVFVHFRMALTSALIKRS